MGNSFRTVAKLKVDIVFASKLLGLFFGTGSIIILYRLSRIISGQDTILNLLPLVFLCFSKGFISYATSGMETQMFVFFLLLSVFFLFREKKNGTGWYLGIFLGLTCLSRPEGILYSSAILGYCLCLRIAKSDLRKDFFYTILSFFLIVVTFFIWRLIYYGDIFPNTYYVKTGGGLSQWKEGCLYAKEFIAGLGGIVLLPALFSVFGALARRDRLLNFHLLFLTIISVSFFFAIYAGGDWMRDFRFFIPCLPYIFLLAQGGLLYFLLYIKKLRRYRSKGLLLSLGFVLLL